MLKVTFRNFFTKKLLNLTPPLTLSPIGRAGTPDEVANVAALLMNNDGRFITGSDFLMDGGVTASYFFGELAP